MTKHVVLRRKGIGIGLGPRPGGWVEGVHDCSVVITGSPKYPEVWPDDVEVVIRHGCTANIPNRKERGIKVVNNAASIHRVADKAKFRMEMQDVGVSTPYTWGEDEWEEVLYEEGPLVVRPGKHHQGRDFYYCETLDAVVAAVRKIEREGKDFYISEYIKKAAEYRVMCAADRVVWVARKTPGNPEDHAWNVGQGGRFDNVRWSEWPLDVVVEALKAHMWSDLFYSGVDVMVGEDGLPYVVEVNSAPSQTSPYRIECTQRMLNYHIDRGCWENIDRLMGIYDRGWKAFIHPGVSDKAIMMEAD